MSTKITCRAFCTSMARQIRVRARRIDMMSRMHIRVRVKVRFRVDWMKVGLEEVFVFDSKSESRVRVGVK